MVLEAMSSGVEKRRIREVGAKGFQFDLIPRHAIILIGRRGYAKFMEWYVALGFLVTFVWLYFSVIRLLQKVRG